jgi:hypothetical protein
MRRIAGGPRTAAALRQAACRLAARPEYQAEMERLRSLAREKASVTADEAVKVLTAQLRFDAGAMLNSAEEIGEDGEKRTVWRIDLGAAKALGLTKFLDGLEIGGDGKIKIKFGDRQGAIDRLAKLFGWYAPEKHEFKLEGEDLRALSDEELRARLRKMIEENGE